MVGVAQDMESERLQCGGPFGIGPHRCWFEVLPTVELDDQLGFDTGEVSEVAADRMLAAELAAGELTVAQGVPQGALGVG
jgi:hypothetical protein